VASIEGTLGNIALADAGVIAVFADRCEPDPLALEPILPALTYKIVGEPHDSDTGTSWARVQFTVWAIEYDDIIAGSLALRRALDTVRGIYDGIEIIQVTYLNKVDLPDPQTGRRTRPMDFQAFYKED